MKKKININSTKTCLLLFGKHVFHRKRTFIIIKKKNDLKSFIGSAKDELQE